MTSYSLLLTILLRRCSYTLLLNFIMRSCDFLHWDLYALKVKLVSLVLRTPHPDSIVMNSELFYNPGSDEKFTASPVDLHDRFDRMSIIFSSSFVVDFQLCSKICSHLRVVSVVLLPTDSCTTSDFEFQSSVRSSILFSSAVDFTLNCLLLTLLLSCLLLTILFRFFWFSLCYWIWSSCDPNFRSASSADVFLLLITYSLMMTPTMNRRESFLRWLRDSLLTSSNSTVQYYITSWLLNRRGTLASSFMHK